MNISKYKVLLAAVDMGSFSAAASSLGYTQSGMTHMMNALEEEIGFPLLQRGYYGIKLTPLGERIIPRIRELVNCEEALYKLINPEVVWFPASSKEVMSNTQKAYATSTDWIKAANYGVCREIERVKLIVSGGDCNTNQLGYNFTLTMTANGIDYENFYDAVGHKVVVTEPEIPQPNQGDCYVILREGK